MPDISFRDVIQHCTLYEKTIKRSQTVKQVPPEDIILTDYKRGAQLNQEGQLQCIGEVYTEFCVKPN